MTTARDTGSRAEVQAADDLPDGRSYVCRSCHVAVVLVSSYSRRQRGGDQTVIPAHFRLAQNVEHEVNCQFVPATQVNALVAGSQAVEEMYRPFNPATNGAHVFRVNILLAALAETTRSGKNWVRPRERTNHVLTDVRLEPYIRSAVGLARIRFELGNDATGDLSRLVRLRLGRNVVLWEQIFFDYERQGDLWDTLRARSSTDLRPTSLVVCVKNTVQRQERPYVECKATFINAENGIRTFAKPYIAGDAELLGHFVAERFYVVYGFWRAVNETGPKKDSIAKIDGSQASNNNENGFLLRSLQVDVFRAAQFAEVVPWDG